MIYTEEKLSKIKLLSKLFKGFCGLFKIIDIFYPFRCLRAECLIQLHDCPCYRAGIWATVQGYRL
jgi:hypothetical protein